MSLKEKGSVDRSDISHVSTSTPHVFKNTKTGKFVYTDETDGFSAREYDTEALAAQALNDYCTFSLDGPYLLNLLKRMLEQPGLDTYTCVHVAKAAFRDGRGEDALIALRTGVDKLRVHNEKLYRLVRNNPPVSINDFPPHPPTVV